ncbi:MAG: hypothetical protein ABI806_08645 [Candidatus Solibacter sp.]
MFTWICPQCGREVPPAYNDCPDCAKKTPPPGDPAQAQSAPPAYPPPPEELAPQPPNHPPQAGPQHYAQPSQAPPPPPPYQQPPPQYYQQPPQQPPPPPQPQYYQAPQPTGLRLPVWLMTILCALAIGGVVFGILWAVSTNRGSAGNGPAPIASVENPTAKPGVKTNQLQKYIEVSGVRFVLDAKKKVAAKFVIVNHSEADINGLGGNVTIWGRTQKSEEDAQGTFTFTTNLGPYESKELSVPLTTKRKIYELADWQNITTDVQITAPQ